MTYDAVSEGEVSGGVLGAHEGRDWIHDDVVHEGCEGGRAREKEVPRQDDVRDGLRRCKGRVGAMDAGGGGEARGDQGGILAS